MNILIVPAVSVREGEFVCQGEIQVVGYREHVEEICHLDELLECARGDLKQAMKISAYDEAKEREVFDLDSSKKYGYSFIETNDDGEYVNQYAQFYFKGWLACAKSRAGIQP